MTLEPQWTYRATVLRWVDGDTVDLRLDPGFRLTLTDRFRVYGIDTPERGQPRFTDAFLAANHLAPSGSEVVVRTYKAPDKYGRWLADIYVGDVNLGARLIEAGLAVPYFGGTKGASA